MNQNPNQEHDQNFTVLPIDSIVANSLKLRDVNLESVAFLELVEDIRVNGVINPPTVRMVDTEFGQQAQLIDGLHRWTAARQAGLTSIPVRIKALNDTEVLLFQISMNSHNIETRPMEYTQSLKRILAANPLMTLAELGKKIGKSGQWVQERLSLTKITNPLIKSLIDEGKISLVNAYALATLPEDEQEQFLTSAQIEKHTEFAPKVAARVQELRNAARQAREPKQVGFVPVALVRKLADLKAAPEDSQVVAKLAAKAQTVEDGVKIGLLYAISMDEDSVLAQQAAFEAKQKAQEAAKAEREQKRRDAAAAKAAEAAEAMHHHD